MGRDKVEGELDDGDRIDVDVRFFSCGRTDVVRIVALSFDAFRFRLSCVEVSGSASARENEERTLAISSGSAICFFPFPFFVVPLGFFVRALPSYSTTSRAFPFATFGRPKSSTSSSSLKFSS